MKILDQIRSFGWDVAVHNDYKLDGEQYTFWLFTHPDGSWVKGEGKTDNEALKLVLGNIETIRDMNSDVLFSARQGSMIKDYVNNYIESLKKQNHNTVHATIARELEDVMNRAIKDTYKRYEEGYWK